MRQKRNNGYYHYFVEGQTEKKIVDVLKSDMGLIISGKVEVFNVVLEKLTMLRIMNFKNKTTVILVFDTDVKKSSILCYNIELLKKAPNVKRVICIPQIYNLEDELKYCCSVQSVKEIINCRTISDFKGKCIKLNSAYLAKQLLKCNLDLNKLWSRNSDGVFKNFINEASLIKLK